MSDIIDYDFFRRKAQIGKLVIFVGAGVSRNVKGMPGWSELVWEMAKEIGYSKCSNCTKRDTCTDSCPLAQNLSNDEYLKIPQYMYNSDPPKYKDILNKNISHKKINAPLSSVIFDINPVHIITTNYDHLLEDSENELRTQYDVIKNDADLLKSEKSKYIIKMHGDIDEPDKIVLKEQDYLNYSQNHVLIEMFVKSLLVDHTVLFLGYSLNDYNVKQIISWINYMRLQNDNTLKGDGSIGYIILDDPKIDETQEKYFENNKIEIININKIQPVLHIPEELEELKGRNLYSFLKSISEPPLDEIVVFLSERKYVSRDQLLITLNINSNLYDTSEVVYLYDENYYNRLVSYMNSDTPNGEKLKNLFLMAGIKIICLDDGKHFPCYNIGEIIKPRLFSEPLFDLYLNNKYDELYQAIEQDETDTMEKCVYLSILNGNDSIRDLFNTIDSATLNTDSMIAYLHNSAVLELEYPISNKAAKFIKNLSSIKERNFYSKYLDIYDGNFVAAQSMNCALDDLKDAINNKRSISIGRPCFSDIYTLKEYAYSKYYFYFSYKLIFTKYEELRSFLFPYLEGIIIANSELSEKNGLFLGQKITYHKYPVDILDIELLSKFIETESLLKLISKYNVIKLNIPDSTLVFLVNCFVNMSESVLNKSINIRPDFSMKVLSNLAILLSLSDFTDDFNDVITEAVQKLFLDSDFCKLLFSDEPMMNQQLQSIKSFSKLCAKLKLKSNISIIKNIVSTDGFMKQLMCNLYVTRNLVLSFVCKDDFHEIESKVIELIDDAPNFMQKKSLLCVFFRLISNTEFKRRMADLLAGHFGELSGADIYEFIDGSWITFTDENIKLVIDDTLLAANEKPKDNFLIEDQLFKVYLLYLEGVIKDIQCLACIADDYDHLQFLLDPDNFDYTKVDFENYMWNNFMKYNKTRSQLIKHKDVIAKKLKDKFYKGVLSEGEKEILFRFFLSEDEKLLNR